MKIPMKPELSSRMAAWHLQLWGHDLLFLSQPHRARLRTFVVSGKLLCGISGYFMGCFCWVLWDFMGFCRGLFMKVFMGFSWVFTNISWDVHGILLDHIRSHRVLWDFHRNWILVQSNKAIISSGGYTMKPRTNGELGLRWTFNLDAVLARDSDFS